jgi:phage shock protein C
MKEKLYRSRRFRVLGGVAGGLATYFNLDPVLVRVLLVIMMIFHGFGLLVYIILWIVIPEEPFELAYQVKPEDTGQAHAAEGENPEFANTKKPKESGRIITGVILIGLGLIFFADRVIPSFDLGDVFPIAMVLIGIALIWNSMKK